VELVGVEWAILAPEMMREEVRWEWEIVMLVERMAK